MAQRLSKGSMVRARLAIALFESLESRTLLSTYYVATTGSDGAVGSTSAPWKTLQKAADTAIAGDTVIVKPGTYAGMNLTGTRYGGAAGKPITFIANTGDWRTSGVTINALPSSTQYAHINLENNKGWYIIKGFNVTGSNQKASIRASGAPNCQILNNQVSKGYTGIFASRADGIVVEGNSTHDATGEHGIYVNGTNGYTIRNNVAYNNNWTGIHTNVLDGGNLINSNSLIEGNVVYNNGTGFNITGASFSTFQNNIAYGNGKHAFVLQNTNQNPTPASHDVQLINNTFDATGGAWAIELTAGNMTNVTVFNNVLLGSSGAIGTAGTLPSTFKSDYNLVSNSFSEAYSSSSRETLASWQSKTGRDTHSIVTSASQLFVNPTSRDYHLKAGSPAIDKGVASFNSKAAPTSDYEANVRPQGGGYDIGADETGSASTITAPAAPSNLTATVASSTQVNLSWTDNASNEAGFKVERATAGGSYALVATLSAGVRSYNDTGLAAGTAYSYRVYAYNSVGNSAYSNVVSATTPAVSTTSQSIWTNAATPQYAAIKDSGVELGVKFSSSVGGYVTGLRFYKASTNTGTHVARLWSSTGQLLATATFTSESASGWQQVNFATPVYIAANTTYIASYTAPAGNYSNTYGYFNSGPYTSGTLTAINSVYTYTQGSFPASTWNNSNYWVDVLFKQA